MLLGLATSDKAVGMKFNQLRYFLHIVEAGSMSKAAKVLGVAQPALSQHIANLEHDLGAKLLERTPGGVHTTPAGDVLSDHARTIFRQVDQARLDITYTDQTPRGEVVVVLAAAAASFIAPALSLAVEKNYPEVRITAMEAMSVRASELVENGHVDLAFLPYGHLLKQVEARPVVTEHLYLIGRQDMDLADDTPIDFKDACNAPLILPSHPHFLRKKLEQTAFDQGLKMDVRADQDSTRLLNAYIETGYAYGILPFTSFYEGISSGKLFARKIVNPVISRQMTIAWSRHKPLNKASKVVADELYRLIGELNASGMLPGDLIEQETNAEFTDANAL